MLNIKTFYPPDQPTRAVQGSAHVFYENAEFTGNTGAAVACNLSILEVCNLKSADNTMNKPGTQGQ